MNKESVSRRYTIAFLKAQDDDFWAWFRENDVGELVGAGVVMRV